MESVRMVLMQSWSRFFSPGVTPACESVSFCMEPAIGYSPFKKGVRIVLQLDAFPSTKESEFYCKREGVSAGPYVDKERLQEMVRLVGLEPTTGVNPADFKPAAHANFATAAPGVTRLQQNIMQ